MTDEHLPAPPGVEEERLVVASIKRFREDCGWSQGDLARRIRDLGWDGFHQTTISRIEKGERPLRYGELYAIAAALGRNESEFLTDDLNSRAERWLRDAMRSQLALRDATQQYAQDVESVATLFGDRMAELNRLNQAGVGGLREATPLEVVRAALYDTLYAGDSDESIVERARALGRDVPEPPDLGPDLRSDELRAWHREIYPFEGA